MSSKNRRKVNKKPPSIDSGRQAREGGKKEPKWLTKSTITAAGIVATAVLTLIVTGVIPKAIGQFVNGAQIEDSLRGGSDIKISESLYYPDGDGVPVPTVVPGNYRPSKEFVAALARPGAAGSPSLEKQIRDANGVDVQDIWIRVVLQGNRNEPILILGVKPVDFSRGKPLNGVFFGISGQGAENNIKMGFDLDQLAPQAVTVGVDGLLSNIPYFESNSINLTDGEQQVLVIKAETKCYSAQFKLAISYMVNGKKRQEIISNNGGDFKVTGPRYGANSYKQEFELQGNFSVTPPTPSEIAAAASELGQGRPSACPAIA